MLWPSPSACFKLFQEKQKWGHRGLPSCSRGLSGAVPLIALSCPPLATSRLERNVLLEGAWPPRSETPWLSRPRYLRGQSWQGAPRRTMGLAVSSRARSALGVTSLIVHRASAPKGLTRDLMMLQPSLLKVLSNVCFASEI